MYLNTQSMLAHMEELEVLIQNENPSVLLLSETRVTEDILDSEISFKGYLTLRCNSESRHTGGVAILVKRNIVVKEISNIAIDKNTWLLAIKIIKGFRNGVYVVVYHSPNASHSDFIEYFENWCDNMLDEKDDVIITGDFNIDVAKHSFYSKKLSQAINNLGMKQIVGEFTRITQLSSTIIDLVITNNRKIQAQVLDTHVISDHCVISVITVEKNTVQIISDVMINDYRAYSPEKLKSKLSKTNWDDVNKLSLDFKTVNFVQSLQDSVNELVKQKKLHVKHNIKKWYTAELRSMQFNRDRCFKIAKLTRQETDWNVYKTKRNEYSKIIRLRKNAYIENQIDQHQKNSKQLWRILKGIVNNDSQKTYNCVTFQNREYENSLEITEEFNKFFINSVKEINDSIPESKFIETPIPEVNESFSFETVSLENIIKIIQNMKNTSTTDGITVQVIKDGLPIIGNTLVEIINESLLTGVFPENWKVATIVPIPKIKQTKKCEEYRPINILPKYEQILEIIVKEQILKFIESKKILLDSQSGFRAKHSCETALNLVLADWKNQMENNNFTVSVFMDFKRAFETIDRNRLIKKLEVYGIRGTEKRWFESYLTLRYQKTKFNNQESNKLIIDLGVPQGSVLGPLLFILYINDIELNCENCNINLFADDTLISVSDINLESAIIKINNNLHTISEWLKINKLKLNTDKTKAMIIGHRTIPIDLNTDIKIENVKLECVSQFKYLGVIIDNKLKFNGNVDYILKKVSKKISFLGRLTNKLSMTAKITVYKTLIAPHFNYCASILFLCNEGDISKLQKQQNRALRIILKCSKYTRVKDMLDTLDWLSIRQTITLNSLLLIFKSINNLLPRYMTKNLIYNRDIHNYQTRTRDDFRLPTATKTTTQNTLYYKGLKIFNELPTDAKQTTSVAAFRELCTEFVKCRY